MLYWLGGLRIIIIAGFGNIIDKVVVIEINIISSFLLQGRFNNLEVFI